jgi:hypothetical protein
VKAEIIIGLVRRATTDQWYRHVIDLATVLSGWMTAPMQALSTAVFEGKNGVEVCDIRSLFSGDLC